MDAPSKSCYLDPTPTWLVRESIDELLPILSRIIVQSLQSSVVPDQYKTGHISPLIKKIERVVAKQLSDHMQENNLHEQFQSAYRQHHSNETAVTKVHCDILSAVDRGCVVVLVMIDLTAAFDTIDHAILLSGLTHRYGVTGAALKWFTSKAERTRQTKLFFKNRNMFHVSINVNRRRPKRVAHTANENMRNKTSSAAKL